MAARGPAALFFCHGDLAFKFGGSGGRGQEQKKKKGGEMSMERCPDQCQGDFHCHQQYNAGRAGEMPKIGVGKGGRAGSRVLHL